MQLFGDLFYFPLIHLHIYMSEYCLYSIPHILIYFFICIYSILLYLSVLFQCSLLAPSRQNVFNYQPGKQGRGSAKYLHHSLLSLLQSLMATLHLLFINSSTSAYESRQCRRPKASERHFSIHTAKRRSEFSACHIDRVG